MRILIAIAATSFVLAITPVPRPAIAAPSGFGVQLGVTSDPRDLVGEIHYILPLARSLAFAPSIDVGTAGGDVSPSLNGDLHVNLLSDAEIGPYVGANFSSYTAGSSDDTSDQPDAAGPTAIAGVWLNQHGGTSWSLETRFGFSGVSPFTALHAVTF